MKAGDQVPSSGDVASYEDTKSQDREGVHRRLSRWHADFLFLSCFEVGNIIPSLGAGDVGDVEASECGDAQARRSPPIAWGSREQKLVRESRLFGSLRFEGGLHLNISRCRFCSNYWANHLLHVPHTFPHFAVIYLPHIFSPFEEARHSQRLESIMYIDTSKTQEEKITPAMLSPEIWENLKEMDTYIYIYKISRRLIASCKNNEFVNSSTWSE